MSSPRTATEVTGQHPGFIVPVLFVGRKLGLAGNELAIATIGRAIGWIAHAPEQYQQESAVRTRAVYTDPLPK